MPTVERSNDGVGEQHGREQGRVGRRRRGLRTLAHERRRDLGGLAHERTRRIGLAEHLPHPGEPDQVLADPETIADRALDLDRLLERFHRGGCIAPHHPGETDSSDDATPQERVAVAQDLKRFVQDPFTRLEVAVDHPRDERQVEQR